MFLVQKSCNVKYAKTPNPANQDLRLGCISYLEIYLRLLPVQNINSPPQYQHSNRLRIELPLIGTNFSLV